MTDEEIYAIGMDLELAGFSHSEIDQHFSHHGVKGQKWGARRAKKHAARVKKQKDFNDAVDVAMKTARSREEAKQIVDGILRKKGYIVLHTAPPPSKATKAVVNGINKNVPLNTKLAQLITG